MAKDIGENIMSTFNEDNVNKTITDNKIFFIKVTILFSAD